MTTELELDKAGVEAASTAFHAEYWHGSFMFNAAMAAAIRAYEAHKAEGVPDSANYTPEQKEAVLSLAHCCIKSTGEFTSAHASTILAIMTDMERTIKAATLPTPAEADAGLVEARTLLKTLASLAYQDGILGWRLGNTGEDDADPASVIDRVWEFLLSAPRSPAQPAAGEFERGLDAAAKVAGEYATLWAGGRGILRIRSGAGREIEAAILSLKPGSRP